MLMLFFLRLRAEGAWALRGEELGSTVSEGGLRV